MGYITSSAAPLGALADLLAAAVNPNVGGWALAPVATEIEAQVVRWLAELVGFGAPCGGIMVSGGNMANFSGLPRGAPREGAVESARRRRGRRRPPADRLRVARDAHVDRRRRPTCSASARARSAGCRRTRRSGCASTSSSGRSTPIARAGGWPFLVVGTAGSVSTGAIDPLREIAAVARAPRALVPRRRRVRRAGRRAAGGARRPEGARAGRFGGARSAQVALRAARGGLHARARPRRAAATPSAIDRATTTSTTPRTSRTSTSYGPQNSRGFRALKVWLCLKHVGRAGYEKMIARRHRARAPSVRSRAAPAGARGAHAEPQHRDVPLSCRAAARAGDEAWSKYLDTLNAALLSALEREGECFVSNAVIDGAQYLRAPAS